MTQWETALAARPCCLSLVWESMREGASFCKFPSNPHLHTMAHAHLHS